MSKKTPMLRAAPVKPPVKFRPSAPKTPVTQMHASSMPKKC